MSNAVCDDESSLLDAVREAFGEYLEAHCCLPVYFDPCTSYILNNVTAPKLDGRKTAVPSVSDERPREETFKDIWKEIERLSSTQIDAHEFALSLPRILRKDYAKGIRYIFERTLTAFALTHGVWLLVLKLVCANSNKEYIATVLKRVEVLFITLMRYLGNGETDMFPDLYLYISLISSSITRKPSDNWESMGSLDSLIMVMLEVITVAQMFSEEVFEFITETQKNAFDSLMLLSIYWVTRGVFACSSECSNLPKNGYIIRDTHKLEDIRKKLVSVLERLQKLYNDGKQYMDDEIFASPYQIPDKEGEDNYYAVMALFGLQPYGSKEVQLFDCSRKNTDIPLASLRRKTFVLIISGLNISSYVIDFLNEIYVESSSMTHLKESDSEFLWLPIYSGTWNTSLEEKYVKLIQCMRWYTVHPTFITEETRQFIRDIWKFQRTPIVVVLNEDGDVVCPNAMHLMYVWRAKAYPYTRMRGRIMWETENRLDSLVLGFDTLISSLVGASKWVILYGGSDINWIIKFTECIRGISVDSGISIEMIYIGGNGESEKIRSLISADTPQNYSLDLKKTWYFWTRLESLLISKHQVSNANVNLSNPIIREVQQLLCYASADSWACLFTPSSGGVMIHGFGALMLQAFLDYELWKQHLHTKDFTKMLYMYVEQLRERQMSDYPCSRITLNIDNKDVVDSLTCPQCVHSMEKKIQYRCCHT